MNASSSRRSGTTTTTQQPSTSTGAVANQEEEDEWRSGSTASHPSFATDERALAEMRLAVGWILESVGFTHAAHSALEMLTDIGVRYMRKLATTTSWNAESDGRCKPTDADVIASFRSMHIDVDEMNEYMRQVRPPPDERVIAAFPTPITQTPIVHTTVPPSLIVPPTDISFPGLPPMSSPWLRREDLEAMIAEKERENEKEAIERRGKRETEGENAVRRLLASGMGGMPSFYSKSASTFGLRKGTRGVESVVREKSKEKEDEKRREKRRSAESKSGRPNKQPRSSAAGPSTSAAFDTMDSTLKLGSLVSQQRSRGSSRAPTPAVQMNTAGPISALRDSTRPTMTTANVPLAGALPPDYAMHTEGVPLSIPRLLAAHGREGSNENQHARKAVPSPKLKPEPPLTHEALFEKPPPEDAPPTRLVQLAILRSLFSKDHNLQSELTSTFTAMKGGVKGGASGVAAPSSSSHIQPSSRVSTPLPPPPPALPRLIIKPPQRPSTPSLPALSSTPVVSSTPKPPLRLKISIGARPSVDTAAPPTPSTPAAIAATSAPPLSAAAAAVAAFAAVEAAAIPLASLSVDDDGTSTVGPSSASTIPLLFSPATAAAAAAAAPMEKEEGMEEEGGEGEGEDREGKKKKKKHKKHKKHKKSSKREEGEEKEGESIERRRESTVEPVSIPEGGGGIKLKIKLGPRPGE